MFEKNISQEFRLKDIDETRNYLIVERNQNELMSKKHKKVCTPLNGIERLIILATVITGSVSAFASLVCIPIGIASSEVGFKLVQQLQELKSINR